MSQTSLDGRCAVITGAGRGIGAAIATTLVEAGAVAVLIDRDAALLSKLPQQLERGNRIVHVEADVSSNSDMAEVARLALSKFGRIDIVCPNAAVFGTGLIAELSEDEWDRLIDINLKGVFLTVKHCLPPMIEQSRGRIIATSSITGNRTAIAGHAHYAASKAGISGFIRAAALELARQGITANAVEPGHVMTEGAAGIYNAEFKAAVERHIPLGRFATGSDIAKAVAFLASDAAAYITGQTLVIDGGVTLPEYPAGFPRGAQ